MDTGRLIDIGSGRSLEIVEGGDLQGLPVIVHNGTPMVAGIIPAHDRDAREKGLRLISYGRPGYGGSDRQKGRSVAAAASDVRLLADALGVDRFATWGISGGGPHALATTALLPERVVAAACLAGIAPPDAAGLDLLAGMGEGNVVEFGAALQGEDALRSLLVEMAGHLADATPEAMVEAMASLLPDVDREVMRDDPEFGLAFAELGRHAARHGVEGWIDDDLAFARPWGFDLSAIRTPVLLWQGDLDLMVPAAHGAWLASRIPGVDARLTSGDGHLTIYVNRVPETHAWLAAQFAR